MVLRILFITTIGFSEHSGGVVYSRALRDAFASLGNVTMLPLAEVQLHKTRLRRWLGAIVKSLSTGVPPNVLFHSGLLAPACLDQLRQRWDLVIVDHLESSFAYSSTSISVLYVSHNREAGLIPQKIPRAPRWIQQLLSFWVDRYERRIVRQVDAIVTISSDEAHWYRMLNPHVAVLPPIFKTRSRVQFSTTEDPFRLGFLGGAKWQPNREAMEVLLNGIIPLTQRPLQLVVAGDGWDCATLHAGLAKSDANHKRISLQYMGCIDDISKFWTAIDVFAAPIISGAGVNVKVCEALANSIPVIALPHAVRGLDGVEKNLVCCVPNLVDFAAAIDNINPTDYPTSPPASLTFEHAVCTLKELLSKILSESVLK